jgi:ATP-dependent helicase Lhr and Lhr-like helicase
MILKKFTPELQRLISKNFDSFTNIQEQTIPQVLAKKNILCIAPTGSGKTEAAFLPIIDFLNREKLEKGIHVLYIAPLKALNRDMLHRMEQWCEEIGCRVEVRHGDTSQYQRSKQRRNPPEMLITTPETLQAILPAKVMREHLKTVNHVIIDEIHELVSDKRGTQLAVALERLRDLCGSFQTVGLSATVGTPKKVADYYKLDEIIIDKSYKSLNIKVERPKDVIQRIAELSKKKSTLVFTNTRVATELLTNRLKGVKDVGIHHSSLSKEERLETERQLKSGELKTVVCTSSMELGIDVGEIEQVIQFNSPRQVSRLIQRVGRSGHSRDKISKGIILVTDFDDTLEATVIAQRALKGNVEETEFFARSSDVLAHQIVGIVLEYGGISSNKVFETIKRAYPYKDLTRESFDAVVDVLKRLRLVAWNENELQRRRKSLFYYYENLSTIPTYNRYSVIDMASGRAVGVLDEEFIVDCYVNSIFILKGEPWRIVDFREKNILVVPVSSVGADTPVWVGEDIPVPFDIAQDVGGLRKKMPKELPLNAAGVHYIKKVVEEQKARGAVPDKMTVSIENYVENYNHVILNACFGTKTNEAISRVLASLLSSKYGETVGIKVDPYRMILTASRLEVKDVLEVINELDPDSLEFILEKTAGQSNLFKFSFLHVAKRFGIFKQDAKFREINLKRVVDSYKGTPVYKEALVEVFQKYFDVPHAKKVLQGLKSGDIKIVAQRITPISKFGLDEFKDAVMAETPEHAIIETVKKRLSKKKVDLVCLNCGAMMRNRTISTLEFPLKCGCGSWMLGYLGGKADELQSVVKKHLRGEALSRQERNFLKRAQQSSALIYSYGERALFALNARGVGPQTADRLLDKRFSDDEFYKEVLRAEREFVRTSKFWRKK